jgi:hypothetical protein
MVFVARVGPKIHAEGGSEKYWIRPSLVPESAKTDTICRGRRSKQLTSRTPVAAMMIR